MPLTMANIGETNTIKRVSGNDETKRFLANLGLVPGAAVNADMARHIMI